MTIYHIKNVRTEPYSFLLEWMGHRFFVTILTKDERFYILSES